MAFIDPIPALHDDADREPNHEPLVTVATYNEPSLAHVDRVILEQAGLTPMVADGNIVAMDWLYANAVGGVKLQVPQSQLAAARDILAAPVERSVDVDETMSSTTCPQCGSYDVYRVTTDTAWFFLGFVLLGIPLLFFRRRLECNACNHRWRT